jgi:hypothetical protein
VKQTKIHLEEAGLARLCFRALVSLHSHTLHSHETLGYVYQLADRFRLLPGRSRARKLSPPEEARNGTGSESGLVDSAAGALCGMAD